MFHKAGIKSVRMDDIAAVCGISKRTLYENFADREDLIRQSMKYHMEMMEAVSREKRENSHNVLEEFRDIFACGADFRQSYARLIKDLLRFYPHVFNEFMEEHHDKLIETNRQRFERGIREGLILDSIDTGFMARILTSYLYGLKKDLKDYDFLWLDDPSGGREGGEPFYYAIVYFFRGLATEKGRKYIDENILNIA